ncbi:signal transducer and activator of transcription 6 [Rhinichthys klamathensis goyatoka]|uniref:signal transducer and activator of transcription 6 n=1 Tax=Rhinichthys klamathensis goyatoka TaxID=3034132 RepID=UPI0024B4E9EB|nr:signal transducer and activator of transcription 6 [Rhinichthys klamathensis goyatoka]
MALWAQISPQLQYLPTETLSEIYTETLPLDVRHYLASWIEEQIWEEFDLDNMEQEPRARILLDHMVRLLQDVAQRNPNVVEKVKLLQCSKNLSVYQPQPMQLVRMVRDMLRKERHLLGQGIGFPPFQPMPGGPPAANGTPQPVREDSKADVDILVLKVLEIQNCRQTLYQLQEDLNWEKQEIEPMQVQNDLDQQHTDQVIRQNRIKQLEYNFSVSAKKRVQLLQEAVYALEQCQSCLILRIKSWRWEQHRATIGVHFDDNLGSLQTWCEQLLGVNGNLKQELMLMKADHGEAEEFHTLQESLALLLQTLIQNSLVVDKQPPQVIKTQSKFSSTVRYLLGEKMVPGKPVVLKAQIITEAQARNLGQQSIVPNENVGDLLNYTAILEHNTASKSTCATFRNMSIKKIKRADRKGSESVTEEKFALLFNTEITITGCESSYGIQTISLPVVVIVHGSQEINAMATIIWDCAFSEPNRIPFVIPERVPWKQMCEALSSKFMSEVQTHRALDGYNLHFLAQKIFDQPDIAQDFGDIPVSWAQFNKEVLPGRNFTFWQWFEGVIDLTKKCLRDYWTDGLIFGFIGKHHLHVLLQNKPNGTFLLRFSDSEMGGITIAYVGLTDNGSRKIQNIQPFTKKDLDSAGLGDRIRDISCISYVYPDLKKTDVFEKFFTVISPPTPDGYLPFKLTTVVNSGDLSSSTPSMPPQTDLPPDFYDQSIVPVYGLNMNQNHFSPHPSNCTPTYMPDPVSGQGPIYPPSMPPAPSDEPIDMDSLEGILDQFDVHH